MIQFLRRVALIFSVAFILVAAISSSPVHAVTVDSSTLNAQTTCSVSQSAQFTALATIPADTYNVYARLPASGQTAAVQVFGQANDSNSQCSPIGIVNASGDSWTLVGTWNGSQVGEDTLFTLASNGLSSILGANRPSIMLVSTTQPTCTPTTECYVNINGLTGYIRPIGTLPDHDSLHVVRPVDPTVDTVTQVDYYVDDAPTYTTATLQPFDLRYVTLPNQKLTRIIEYASGQELVLDSSPPADFSDTLFSFLYRLYSTNAVLVYVVGSIIIALIVGSATLTIIRAIRRRRRRLIAHGFIKETVSAAQSPEQDYLHHRRITRIERIIVASLIGIAIIGVVIVVNNTTVTLYRVNGHSMESTYADGTETILNEIPITWAHLRGVDYVPSRGSVVILHEIFGITDDASASADGGQYLIKRVIGLPGERVVVANNVITIYNATHPNGFNPDTGAMWQPTMHADTSNETVDVTLAKDELFVVGDNRPVSVDSRFNGPILTKQVIGIVETKL